MAESTPVGAPRTHETLVEAVAQRRRLEPDAAVLVDAAGRVLTCADLYDRALRTAHGLRTRGIGPGRHVILVSDDDSWAEFAVTYLGVLMSGAVAVPVSAAQYVSAVDGRTSLDPALVVCHGTVWVPDTGIATAGPADLTSAAEAELPQLTGGMPAEVSFTAGTEGPPKAVLSYHETLCARYTSVDLASQPTTGGGLLLALPFGNTFAQTVFVDVLQTPRGCAYTAPGFEPRDFVDRLRRHPIEVTFLVPAMVETLMREPDLDWTGTEHVQVVCVSGSAVRAEALAYLAARLPAATVVNSYCSTETWPAGTEWVYTPGEPVCAGHPWEGREVRVLDPAGLPCPAGVSGRIELRTVGIRRRQPLPAGADTAAPGSDGWVGTDDLGMLDDEGRLHVVGRRGEIMTVGGVQVAPAQLEAALLRHPSVHDAVVLPLPHPTLGTIPVALVVTDTAVPQRELLGPVIDAVGVERAPRAVHRVEAIPRSEAGKIVRSRAAELLAQVQRRESLLDDPAALLAYVVTVCGELLGDGTRVNARTNLFTHGGDSLTAQRFCRTVAGDLGVELRMRTVFENPVLGDLAAAVAARIAPAEAGSDRVEVA